VKKIDPTILRELIEYAPETGRFHWRFRDRKWFDSDRVYKSWNTKWAGKEAFTSTNAYGYKQARVLGEQITGAHQLAWAIHCGEWPSGLIDHINGDKTDNRICNLRDVKNSESMKNLPIRKDNKSGICGVCWDSRRGGWLAGIGVSGRTKFLGCFDSVDLAANARRAAEESFGYHANHGRAGVAL